MAARACLARLRKEYKSFDAPPYIRAAPLEHNIQEWRFVLQGPPDSVYEGGMYQGKVRFPDDYPFKPPSIYMLTPSGRFETDRRLCLSMSDFHPETWVPTWSVATILNGVLSFMLESSPTTGSVETTVAEKQRLRDASVGFNKKDPVFCQLFPELVDGKPFTTPGQQPAAAVQPAAARGASGAAPAAPPAAAPPADAAALPLEATAAAGTAGLAGMEALAAAVPSAAPEGPPGSGKNAAKNRKKRDKEKARKAAAAAPEEDGEEEAEHID